MMRHSRIIFFFLIISFSLFSCGQFNLLNARDQSHTDNYWTEITLKYREKKSESFLVYLKHAESNILDQLQLDSQDNTLIHLWGKSYNFDSGAKQTILDETIIRDLQGIFNITNDNRIVHAGIMHTYGYLFSTLETPYGFKRKRWIDPTIDFAFELNGKSISPHPRMGTLLSNLTFFAGKIAFSEKINLALLDQLKFVGKELKDFSYSKLQVKKLDEIIKTPKNIQLTLRTTLVKFWKKDSQEANDYLLIYSTLDQKTLSEQLITAFPITMDAYRKIVDSQGLGIDRPILVRYNAYIGTTTEDRLSGDRNLY